MSPIGAISGGGLVFSGCYYRAPGTVAQMTEMYYLTVLEARRQIEVSAGLVSAEGCEGESYFQSSP